MKRTIIYSLCLLPIISAAQAPFTLKGKIGNYSAPAKVFISYAGGPSGNKLVRDSAVLTNGVFTIKGPAIKEPKSIELQFSPKGYSRNKLVMESYKKYNDLEHIDKFRMLVQAGKNEISSKDSLKNSVIGESQIELQRRKFEAFIKPVSEPLMEEERVWTAMAELRAQGKAVDEKAFLASLEKRMVLERAYKLKLADFVRANPDDYFSAVALTKLLSAGTQVSAVDQQKAEDLVFVKELVKVLTPKVKQYQVFAGVQYYISELEKKPVDIVYKNFSQFTPEGKSVSLDDFKGKYLFVDFWASWCGPCRGENPNVLRAYNSYKQDGLEILGVSFDDKKEAWLKAIEEDKMPWTQISVLKGFQNEAADLYEIQGIPASILINPDGKIIAYDLRAEDLERKLLEIFKH
ncbi:TlpA disulfide reductase family protein [Pedobacter gandavensis]|uniref:TlpA disulfide reductase family protein n=1 Tax=Pedobacter gandavensis TaxID=2679963 RepID=UPI00247A5B14|nr:TlpA disulfide reductase family protein [Pedobacter gandavensis]WGQ10575.1 TlpA disulfide reductase family protein [Pedobacter gandavensis]